MEVTMKKPNIRIAVAAGLICGYVGGVAQAQWQLQETLSGNPWLVSVSTVNRNVAWTIGQAPAVVYRTTNGGETWMQRTSTPEIVIMTIEALDSNTAFIGTYNESASAGLYRTTDGGQSWQLVYLPPESSDWGWNWIHFFDSQNGIACYEDKNGSQHIWIVKTNDGGDTWTPIHNQPDSNSYEYALQNVVHFYDNLNGWFGTLGGRLFHTIDGGETWDGFDHGNTGIVWGIRFISPMVGIRTSGSSPYLTRSADGGETWTPVSDLPVLKISSIGPASSVSTPATNQLWVSGLAHSPAKPFMLTSVDSGITWHEQTIPELSGNYVYHMSAVKFGAQNDSVQVFGVTLNDNAGKGGQILNYRQPIGHVTAVNEERPDLPLEYTLSQNYPNPFNPQTAISFVLAARGKVTLTVHNALGRQVGKLIEAEMPAGSHQIVWDAKDQPSGVYFYRLTTKNFNQMRKMVLLR